MSASAQSWPKEAEVQFLEGLRARYEAEGFVFKVAPSRSELPSFLGSYEPDAIAQRPGLNIAIEVKRSQSSANQTKLREIRRLFEGHPDWQFNVLFMGAETLQSLTISPAQPAAIRARMDEVAALDAAGHHEAAFVLAWSLLEAALHSLGGETSKPRAPGALVHTLAMNGHIEPNMERRMRPLVDLRNRVVHGDLSAEPTSADVAVVLSAVEETLSADA